MQNPKSLSCDASARSAQPSELLAWGGARSTPPHASNLEEGARFARRLGARSAPQDPQGGSGGTQSPPTGRFPLIAIARIINTCVHDTISNCNIQLWFVIWFVLTPFNIWRRPVCLGTSFIVEADFHKYPNGRAFRTEESSVRKSLPYGILSPANDSFALMILNYIMYLKLNILL